MKIRHRPKIGDRFGSGVIVENLGSHLVGKCRLIYWMLKCDCGKTYKASTSNLNYGHVTSCGHVRNMAAAIRNKARAGTSRIGYEVSVIRYRLAQYKRSGNEWNLTYDQFRSLIYGSCVYCGTPPTTLYRAKANANRSKQYGAYYGDGILMNGVDRIDSSRGYFPDNVVSCCTRCNLAKLDSNRDDFIAWILRAAKHLTGEQS